MAKRKLVARTRNNGTWTEARYWSAVRSALRRGFTYWQPAMQCKKDARRAYRGGNKRQKWEYKCAKCAKWFMGKEVQVDHIVPVGTLTSSEHLPQFLERLTPEKGFQLLCRPCHQKKTNRERLDKK